MSNYTGGRHPLSSAETSWERKARKAVLSAFTCRGCIFALFVTSKTWKDFVLCRSVNLIMFYFITKMEAQ